MKVRQNYTLDYNLVMRLKKDIPAQRRSQFVESAIRNKLDKKEAYSLGDITDEELLRIIVSRNWNRDGTNNLPNSFIELIREHFE